MLIDAAHTLSRAAATRHVLRPMLASLQGEFSSSRRIFASTGQLLDIARLPLMMISFIDTSRVIAAFLDDRGIGAVGLSGDMRMIENDCLLEYIA